MIDKKELARILTNHAVGQKTSFSETEVSDDMLSLYNAEMIKFIKKYPDFEVDVDDYSGKQDDEFVDLLVKIADKGGFSLIEGMVVEDGKVVVGKAIGEINEDYVGDLTTKWLSGDKTDLLSYIKDQMDKVVLDPHIRKAMEQMVADNNEQELYDYVKIILTKLGKIDEAEKPHGGKIPFDKIIDMADDIIAMDDIKKEQFGFDELVNYVEKEVGQGKFDAIKDVKALGDELKKGGLDIFEEIAFTNENLADIYEYMFTEYPEHIVAFEKMVEDYIDITGSTNESMIIKVDSQKTLAEAIKKFVDENSVELTEELKKCVDEPHKQENSKIDDKEPKNKSVLPTQKDPDLGDGQPIKIKESKDNPPKNTAPVTDKEPDVTGSKAPKETEVGEPLDIEKGDKVKIGDVEGTVSKSTKTGVDVKTANGETKNIGFKDLNEGDEIEINGKKCVIKEKNIYEMKKINEDNTIELAKAYKVNMEQVDYDELGDKISREDFKKYFNIPDDADEDPSYARDKNFDPKNLSKLTEGNLNEAYSDWDVSFKDANIGGVKISKKDVHRVKAQNSEQAIKKAATKAGLKGDDWKGTTTNSIKKVNENKNDAPVEEGDTVYKDGKEGKVTKVMDDMANVDFGGGDVYGIMFTRFVKDGDKMTITEDVINEDKFSIIQVTKEENGEVEGYWTQDHVGTLDSATKVAIDTEAANSNKQDYAVVSDIGGTTRRLEGNLTHLNMKRLDTKRINATTNEGDDALVIGKHTLIDGDVYKTKDDKDITFMGYDDAAEAEGKNYLFDDGTGVQSYTKDEVEALLELDEGFGTRVTPRDLNNSSKIVSALMDEIASSYAPSTRATSRIEQELYSLYFDIETGKVENDSDSIETIAGLLDQNIDNVATGLSDVISSNMSLLEKVEDKGKKKESSRLSLDEHLKESTFKVDESIKLPTFKMFLEQRGGK